MPQHHRKDHGKFAQPPCRNRHDPLADQHFQRQHRQQTFAEIQRKTYLARQRAYRPGHIGCPDIAGADSAYIDAFKFADNKAAGDRPDQVTGNCNTAKNHYLLKNIHNFTL